MGSSAEFTPGQDGHVRQLGAGLPPVRDDLRGRRGQFLAGGATDDQAVGVECASGCRADRLDHPFPVVGEQVGCRVDHDRGTPIVDFQRVVGGAGKVAVVVDQVLGGRARIAVQNLVAVVPPTLKQPKPGAFNSRMSSRCAGVRSWNSSTSRWRQRS